MYTSKVLLNNNDTLLMLKIYIKNAKDIFDKRPTLNF